MRILTMVVLALALNGCTPPRAVIRTEVRGNDLVFSATMSGPLPFTRHTVDLQPDLVRVDHEGRIVWRIERKRDQRCLNYGGGGPSAVFALTYGKVPPCFTEVARPESLTVGTLYRVAAVGGSVRDNGLGYFRTGVTVHNVDGGGSGPASWGEIESVYNVAATSVGAENGFQRADPLEAVAE